MASDQGTSNISQQGNVGQHGNSAGDAKGSGVVGGMPPAGGIAVASPVVPGGFTVPVITFPQSGQGAILPPQPAPVTSMLAASSAIPEAELVQLSATTGTMIYYPRTVRVDQGDVFYLRERDQDGSENGLIVQVIEKGTASYAQVDQKVLFRLLTAVRARQLDRAHHEPPETIDMFLSATFMVRAAIIDGRWMSSAGQVVTRNIDIFQIDPAVLLGNILCSQPAIDVHLGDFKDKPLAFSGQGFDKVNLITGMKNGGKSHTAKGIIDESRRRGMSAVVFDMNREYGTLPRATVFRPTVDVKFRLDRMEPRTFIDVIRRLAPFADRTQFGASAGIRRLFEDRIEAGKPLDIAFLKTQANIVFPSNAKFVDAMRDSYVQSLETLESFNLFATKEQIEQEDAAIKAGQDIPAASLTSAFYNLDQRQEAGVVVFSIGGLSPDVQRVVVKLVRDGLKEICDRQAKLMKDDAGHVPQYPTVYFEEAHMYMDDQDINELIPVIRHLGMNLFFITNTPGDLPDAVFRLLDNLIMTRLLNDADIRRVVACGLADKETIDAFAPQIPDRHALFLSAANGVTRGFPLLARIRDFGLPASGATRSMWAALAAKATTVEPDTAPGQ